MGVHTYFKTLSDLEHLYRLPGKFKFQTHNVAAHSFKVTKIAQFLGTVEEMNGETVDWRSLYEKALNHDYAELFTGDIKTPVKYATAELKELFSEVEEKMARRFIETEFPTEFHEAYFRRLREGKDQSLEGRILAVADKVDLLYEAYGEILKRNPDPLFFEIYEEALNTILRFHHMHSVQYFTEHIMPDMLGEKFMPHSELRDLTERIIQRYE